MMPTWLMASTAFPLFTLAAKASLVLDRRWVV